MESEACNIIQLHQALQHAFPDTQFLWHPTNAMVKYSFNFAWNGTRDDELILQMQETHKGAQLIHLTKNGKIIYYK